MAINNNITLIDDVNEATNRMELPEERLGKELCQPFSAASSGARKLMFGTHIEHTLPLMKPEVPLIQTGFESEYGYSSSSYVVADYNAKVITKIEKYSMNPGYHYFILILREDGVMDIITRVSYNHITETYGYCYNTDFLDKLKPGSTISEGDVLYRSASFDEYGNKMDGINALVTYLACDDTIEDGILLSESAAKKFVSPLFKKIQLIINDNDIPLNMYGDNNEYKIIPDIGEEIKNGILTAIRREDRDESFFTQSVDRLRKIMMSDEKITTKGKVIDIDVYCNNTDNIKNSIYNAQLLTYWEERIRWCRELVNEVNNMKEKGYTKMSYNLEKMYTIANMTIEGKKFNRTKPFSNIGLDIIVMEETPINQGDKLSNRYGGKGVTAKILPDKLMPRVKETRQHVDMIYNQATVTNRLNISQLFEYEINQISYMILQAMVMTCTDVADALSMLIDFVEIFNPRQAEYYREITDNLEDEDICLFIDTVTTEKGINLSLLPVTDNVTIDKLAKAKERFRSGRLLTLEVPIVDSEGEIRYVDTVRPIVCGYEYIYRLKQYAEEKFSTTSLSSTNLRGENSRTKAASLYKGIHTKTPIRFGDMETMGSAHLGMDVVVIMLMLNATSPLARRRAEELITSPTIEVDIKLGVNDTSRIVESLNAYFKAMGLRLTFEKKYVGTKPVYLRRPYDKCDVPLMKPFTIDESLKDLYISEDGLMKVMVKCDLINQKALIKPILIKPYEKYELADDSDDKSE